MQHAGNVSSTREFSSNFVCNNYALDKIVFRRETENDVTDILFTHFQQ